ncbi:MAG: hypothetical protein MK008_12820 [Bdellovibrionales bacterium]|nr:hypothetical protein [Bdellovibrionales bacterium]
MALLSFMFVFSATAQNAGMEQTLIKHKFESLITEQLDKALSTTLTTGTYEVYAEVDVVKKAPQAGRTPSSNEMYEDVIPSDLTLGVIDAEPLIRMYAKKVAELEKTNSSMSLSDYEIRSVSINLGISGDYSDSYRSEMQEWLKRWSRFNLTNEAKTTVSFIRSPDKGPDSPNSQKPEESFLDKLSKMQVLLGLLALAAVLFVTAILFSIISNANGKRSAEAMLEGQKALAKAQEAAASKKSESGLDSQQLALEAEEDSKTPENSFSDESVSTMQNLKEIKELGQKIKYIYKDVSMHITQISNIWVESGRDGMFKLASFMDTRMDYIEDERSVVNFKIPESKQEEMTEVFKEMTKLTLAERLKLTKDVYWDLMAVKTFGFESMKKPFAYLSNIESGQIKELAGNQPNDVQAMMVLNMPDQTRDEYLKTIDADSKKEILKTSLNMSEVNTQDIEMMSETVKNVVTQKTTGKKSVSTLPLSIKLIKGLNAYEEIEILRSVVSGLSDRGNSIKQSYATLAFVDEWSDKSLEVFFEGLPPEQVIALLQVVPSAQKQVLESLPPRLKQIVGDDLQMQQTPNRTEVEKHLFTLRNRLNLLVSRGNLDPQTLYGDDHDETLQSAA